MLKIITFIHNVLTIPTIQNPLVAFKHDYDKQQMAKSLFKNYKNSYNLYLQIQYNPVIAYFNDLAKNPLYRELLHAQNTTTGHHLLVPHCSRCTHGIVVHARHGWR